MVEQKSIASLVRDTRQGAIQKALAAREQGDFRAKARWEARRAFLDTLEKLLAPPAVTRRVFVSYNKDSGEFVYQRLRDTLGARHFEVRTGFERTTGDGGNLLNRVLDQLRQCSFYVGVLTRTMRVMSDERTALWAPSVWTMEEKGMALALGLPVFLLVHEAIHQDFWLKTTPERVHYRFSDEALPSKVQELADALDEKYDVLASSSLNFAVPR